MALAPGGFTGGPRTVLRSVSTQNFRLSERHYGPLSETAVHAHVNHYIIVTLDGNYQSTFDTRAEEYAPGTVTFHRAGTWHNSRYSADGARVLYIELPPEQMRSFGQTAPSHLRHFSLRGGRIEWTARQLYREFDAGDEFSPILMESFVTQLMAYLLREQEAGPRGLPIWLGKADEIIRKRFTQPLGLSEIARQVQVHPGHLAREYARHYRCTIGEQIRRLRVEFACEQLTLTEHGLAEIACGAGFSDQSHFTVSFKQQIGVTPSRYRKVVKEMLRA